MVKFERLLGRKSYFSGLILGLLISLFYFATIFFTGQPKPPINQSSANPTITPKLLYLNQVDSHRYQIESYDVRKKVSRPISSFSTARPISSISGLKKDGSIVAVEATDQEFSGRLVMISPDGQVSQLTEPLSYSSPPVLSPDESAVIYIKFSNAEKDFGFSLVELQLTSSRLRTIVTNSSTIGWPRYCFDHAICYLRQVNDHSELVKQASQSQSTDTLMSSQSAIAEIHFLGDVAAIIDTIEQSTSRLLYLSHNQPEVIFQSPKWLRQPSLSPDTSSVAFLTLNKPLDAAGQLTIINRQTQAVSIVKEPVAFILGWSSVAD